MLLRTSRGNSRGTLSDEHREKPATTTREQARRINYLAFGVVTAGCRFESCPVHQLSKELSIRSAIHEMLPSHRTYINFRKVPSLASTAALALVIWPGA